MEVLVTLERVLTAGGSGNPELPETKGLLATLVMLVLDGNAGVDTTFGNFVTASGGAAGQEVLLGRAVQVVLAAMLTLVMTATLEIMVVLVQRVVLVMPEIR